MYQGPSGGLPRMTGRVWLLSSALGVVCGGKSTLRSQKEVAGGSSSPNSSSTHCQGEPGSPITAQCLLPDEAVLGWPYLDWGWEGPQGQWEGQNHQWGWPGRGIVFGIWLWTWVEFRLSSLGARGKSWGSRRPRSTQCFIEKSQAQLGQLHSTWLDEGLCPQQPEPDLPAGRPSSASPFTVLPPFLK